MKEIIIKGNQPLKGEVTVGGAKNSALPIICACLLTKNVMTLKNIPYCTDVLLMLKIIEELNVKVNIYDDYVVIDSREIKNQPLLSDEIKKIRGSYYLMGALISLFKSVEIAYPGGCSIGKRPIDFHIKGFRALDINVEVLDDSIKLTRDKIRNTVIKLRKKSVGATINLTLASVFGFGKTKIYNYAKEPEVMDVINFLLHIGMDIIVFDEFIEINGICESNFSGEYEIISDRIEAGTYLIIGALLGNIKVKKVNPSHLESLFLIFDKLDINYSVIHDEVTVEKKNHIKPFSIVAKEYPGFPTDLQPIISNLMVKSRSECYINDTIYENRFNYLKEFKKLKVKVDIYQSEATILGNDLNEYDIELIGEDLRGTAALVVLSLINDGVVKVKNCENFTRGYVNFIENLKELGAQIEIVE